VSAAPAFDLQNFAARSSNRISVGHTPPPGACSTKPAWWSRDDWAGVEVWCVLAAHAAQLRGCGVAPATAAIVARHMAQFADFRTGRDCRPTRARIAELTGVTERHIARVWRVLERLGLIEKLVEGRSVMSRSERLAAWRRGSAHRRLAAEFALLSGRRRPQASRTVVEDVTPPGVSLGNALNSRNLKIVRNKYRTRTGASRRAAIKEFPWNRTFPADFRSRRLVSGVRDRISWLRDVSPRRLTCLARFARAGWTPRDVHLALDEVLRARRWSVPDRLQQPAAYLAGLLRDVDPADRPGALEDAMHAEESIRREWVWQTTLGGTICSHGHPGGAIPHPVDGHLACPACRAERA